jgi:hypothetical protein
MDSAISMRGQFGVFRTKKGPIRVQKGDFKAGMVHDQ